MSTDTAQNKIKSGSISSSDSNLKVYELTDSQFAKIKHSLMYLARKAQQTNGWFTLKHFTSDGKHYLIFNLSEDAANHLITNGKDVPIKILGRLHRLGNKTDQTSNQTKDRYTVSYLSTDKGQGREMSKIIAKDLQGSQLGEIACSACGRRQKNRVQLWTVRKMQNDQYDQATQTQHEYSYLGSECIKQGFLGTDVSYQQLNSIIDRINEVEKELEDAPSQSLTQVYQSFDVQLNKALKQNYSNFLNELNNHLTEQHLNSSNELNAFLNKIQLHNNNLINYSEHSLLTGKYNNSSFPLNQLMRQEYPITWWNSNIASYIQGNTNQLDPCFAIIDKTYQKYDQQLTTILTKYRNVYTQLAVKKQNIINQFNTIANQFKQKINQYNEQLGNSINEEDYPEQLYIQNALETIKNNRQLDDSTMRNAREIVMATQENKIFVPTLISQMKRIINFALNKKIKLILIAEFNKSSLSNNQSSEKFIQELQNKYKNEFLKIKYPIETLIKTDEQAGQQLTNDINELIKQYKVEKVQKDQQNQQQQEQLIKEDPIKYHPFNHTWGGYHFTDNEISKLRNGETIVIPWLNKKRGISQEVYGKLGFHTFRGKEIFGFQPTKWGKIIY